MADNDYEDDQYDSTATLRLSDVSLSRSGASEEPLSSDVALPLLMLAKALKRTAHILADDAKVCLVIKVPTADWVDPIVKVARQLTTWTSILAAEKPTKENGQRQISLLAGGGKVLCVSAAPERLLPVALMNAADHVVDLGKPDDADVSRLIALVTRMRPPKVAKGTVARLSFGQIVAAVRLGSTPKECIDRLAMTARASTKEDPSLKAVPHLSDLHGYGAAKDWGMQLIADLEAWRAGKIAFDDIQRCAVLASAPGLGKTTFARSLAKSAGLPFYPSSVGTWFSQSAGYLDSIVKQIDSLFNSASADAPALILLDELDGCPNRATMDSRHAEWWAPVVGHLLTTLDGASSNAGRLIVLGATNHPEKLDAGLIRPGRLSRVIHIGLPDQEALIGIMRQHLQNDLADANLAPLALAGVGATGADVTDWVRGARAFARQQGRPVCLDDLTAQIVRVASTDPHITFRIAMHEAGHAMAAVCLGIGELKMVSIATRGSTAGRTSIELSNDLLTKADTELLAMYVLAGRCAEEVALGSASTGAGGGDGSDLAKATDLVAANHTSMGMGRHLVHRALPGEARHLMRMDPHLLKDVENDLRRIREQTVELMVKNRRTLEGIAGALVVKTVLAGNEVEQIVAEQTQSGSRING